MHRTVGLMQGRLSPPPPHRVQAFPWTHWEDELALARECGIDAIEWLFEIERCDENPIMTDSGTERIREIAAATGTAVATLCADYFMARPLFVADAAAGVESAAMLHRLIERAASAGIRTILMPVLEESELRSDDDRVRLLDALAAPLDRAHALGMRIGLETELPAAAYLSLVRERPHPALGAYYDTGNAAARGYDTARDLQMLAPVLCGVHLKDRPVGGRSVPLGEGAARFDACFEVLARAGYQGPLVMQPAFGQDYLSDARRSIAFVRQQLAAAERSRTPQ